MTVAKTIARATTKIDQANHHENCVQFKSTTTHRPPCRSRRPSRPVRRSDCAPPRAPVHIVPARCVPLGLLVEVGGNPTYALNCAFVFRTAHGAHARRDARQVPLRDITSSHGVPGRVRLSPMLNRRCQGIGTHQPLRGLDRRLAARCGLPPLTLTGLLGDGPGRA
jgi:hypothetical protein